MMNVSGIRSYFILAFCALTILGCEEPDVSMGSLGKKFQAPSLTGASPFDQNMNTDGYVRFQGSCDPRVMGLSISLDEVLWFQVPATPITTNTILTGTEVNDASCETDGHFDFYLTKTDLTSWGYAANVDVAALFVRGTTIIGETQVLKIQDNKTPGSGNGGNTGVASQVVLEKTWPTGFAGSGQCEYFNASIRDANNYFTTTAANVTFSLDSMIASAVNHNILGYNSLTDCVASMNPKTSFTIPGGKNSLSVYYRFPDAPFDGVINFRASSVSLTTTTSAYVPVTLRDSSKGLFWISSFSPNKVGKDMCTKANFDARMYNGSMKSPLTWTPTVTGTNAGNLHFFSDASCVNEVTSFDGTNGNTFYFKYTAIAVSTSNLTLTISHTINTTTFGSYDDIPQKLEIDRSGNTTLAHFDFYTQDSQTRGVCNQTQINTYNNQGTLVTPNILVSFTSTAGAAFFMTAADCGTATGSVNALAVTAPQTTLYYRVLGAPSSTQSISMSSAGLTTATRNFIISDKATTVSALFNGLPDFVYPAVNICTPLNVEAVLSDNVRDGTTYTNNFGESKLITVQLPTGYTLYSDAGCNTTVAGNSLGFNLAVATTSSGPITFYIKANSTAAAAQFYVYQTTGGATGYLGSSNPNLVIGP